MRTNIHRMAFLRSFHIKVEANKQMARIIKKRAYFIVCFLFFG
jgi:hypothetical protein